jgi:hypothetical protein
MSWSHSFDDGRTIKCVFCKSEAHSLIAADRARWDWFTGYNRAPTYACGACLSQKGGLFAQMRDRAHTKPEGIMNPRAARAALSRSEQTK